MMKNSLWLDTMKELKAYPPLSHPLVADICIVGGGITGITLAYLLRNSGLKIVLIDSDRLLHGTTAYTTGKVTAQHDAIYHDLIKNFGEYRAKLYANAQREAIEFVAKTVEDLQIDCEFSRQTAYLYTEEEKNIHHIEQEYDAAKQLGFDCELLDDTPLPFSVKKALAFHQQAQFHPLNYLEGLLRELTDSPWVAICEETAALDITFHEESGIYEVHTNHLKPIQAKKVVQTCHYPFYDGGSLLVAKMEARRTYLTAVKGDIQGMYLSYDTPTRTIRGYKDWIIVGGGDHRTGIGIDTNEKMEDARAFASKHFGSDFYAEWSAQDYIPLDQVPYVGAIKDQPLYVATGFRKWGMTNGVVAAMLLHDLLLDRKNPWEELFHPGRVNVKAQYKKLATYTGRVVYELLKGKLRGADTELPMEKGEARLVKTDNGTYGVYRDENDELFAVDVTCPHAGCELNFNESDTTWDCPCHGSRFSYTGDIISGPAHHRLCASPEKNRIDPNLF